MLGDILIKKPATAKVEKFLASQVRQRLKEMQLDVKIENSFDNLNRKIQERLARLRSTQFEVPADLPGKDKEN